jgi:hypothetical protein
MSLERQKLLKAVREFGGYIATNQRFIPDYGDRDRKQGRTHLDRICRIGGESGCE